MPTIFQAPSVVLRDETGTSYPNAKAFFYLTGTSTAADVYQDADLATPHAVPVVADSAGIFPVIYLDSNIEYDVTLEDQNSNVLSGPTEITQGPTQLGGNVSALTGNHTVLTTEFGYLFTFNGSYTATLPSASSAGEGWSALIRNIGSGIVTIVAADNVNGESSIGLGRNATALIVCTGTTWYAIISGYEMGSFTATQTGYSASLTPTVYWMRQGTLVTVFFPSASTGTSNAATMTIQLPSTLNPANTSVSAVLVTDNGTQGSGLVSVSTSGLATFGKAVTGTGGFTTSGTKGFAAGTQFVYSLG